MNETVVTIIELVVMLVAFLVGRYILPKYKTEIQDVTAQFAMLLNYASAFCEYAEQFMDCTGEEKMNSVVEKLGVICMEHGIELDQETLRAIGQKAYSSMKAGSIQADKVNK